MNLTLSRWRLVAALCAFLCAMPSWFGVAVADVNISTPLNLNVSLDLVQNVPIKEGDKIFLTVETDLTVNSVVWYKGATVLGASTSTADITGTTASGTKITIGTKWNYTIPAAQKSDTGVYYCQISNGQTIVSSSLVQYTVVGKPNLAIQPLSKLVVNQDQFNLRVDPVASAKSTFFSPSAVAVDVKDQNWYYVADTANNVIRSVSPGGTVATFAGSKGTINSLQILNAGTQYSSPRVRFDGAAGTGAQGSVVPLSSPSGRAALNPSTVSLTVNPEGGFIREPQVYISDNLLDGGNGAIAKVDFIAGAGSLDTTGLVPLTRARFNAPEGIAVSPSRKLYVADTGNHAIRMIDLADTVNPKVVTVAGLLGSPGYVDGTVGGGALLAVTGFAGGKIISIGVGKSGTGYDIIGASNVNIQGQPVVVVSGTDALGRRSENDPGNPVVKVCASGAIASVDLSVLGSGYTSAPNVKIVAPPGGKDPVLAAHVAPDGSLSDVQVMDGGFGFSKGSPITVTIDPPPGGGVTAQATATITGVIGLPTTTSALVNAGTFTFAAPPMVSVMGATATRLNRPRGIKVDRDENVIIADTDNHAIRLLRSVPRYDKTGSLTHYEYRLFTIAGDPASRSSGHKDDNGSAATFYRPYDVAIDYSAGHYHIYVADYENHVIRRIEVPTDDNGSPLFPSVSSDPTSLEFAASCKVTTVAGKALDAAWKNGAGTEARFWHPSGLYFDATSGSGVLYVSELGNNLIRRIVPLINGTVQVEAVAGQEANRGAGYADGAGISTQFAKPQGVSMDSYGNLYVADADNHAIRKISQIGTSFTNSTTHVGVARLPGVSDTPVSGAMAEFFFQWSKDGKDLADRGQGTTQFYGEQIIGSQTRLLTVRAGLWGAIPRLNETNSGLYSVKVYSGAPGNLLMLSETYPGATVTVKTPDFPPVSKEVQIGKGRQTVDILGDVIANIFSESGVKLSNPTILLSMVDGSDLPGWIAQDGQTSSRLYVTPPVEQASRSVILQMTVTEGPTNKVGLLVLNVSAPSSLATQRPLVSTQPSANTLVDSGQAVKLQVQALGDNLTYQWKKNGQTLVGQTNSSLSISRVNATDSGFYTVDITNPSSGLVTTSDPGQLVVASSVKLSTQPSPLVVLSGNADDPNQVLRVSPIVQSKTLFNLPRDLSVNRTTGEILVSDQGNSLIRKLTLGGQVTLVAGAAGEVGDRDDAGAAAHFSQPSGLSFSATGDGVFADTENNKVKRIFQPDIVRTVLAGLNKPQSVVADYRGNLYVADSGSHAIRVVHAVEAVIGVDILQGGSFAGTPSVEFQGGGGAGAVGAVVANNGLLHHVEITNPGTGYKIPPTVVFKDNGVVRSDLKGVAILSGRLSPDVNILSGGSGYKVAPSVTLTGGGVTQAVATPRIDPVTGQLKAIALAQDGGGMGYTQKPVIQITDPTGKGSGAVVDAVIRNGSVVRVDVLQPGSNYSSQTYVEVLGGGLQQAQVTASMGVGPIKVLSVGGSYSQRPTVRFEGGGGTGAVAEASVGISSANVAADQGLNIRLEKGGSNFTTAPTLTVSPPDVQTTVVSGVDGSIVSGTGQASVIALLGDPAGVDAGKVVQILVYPGNGYTKSPTVTIDGASYDKGLRLSGAVTALTNGSYTFTGELQSSSGGFYVSAPTPKIVPNARDKGTGVRAIAQMGIRSLNFDTRTGGGAGYTSKPKVTFVGGNGSNASAEPVLGLDTTSVINSGSGYLYPPTVAFLGGGGTGAAAEALMGIGTVKVGTLAAGVKQNFFEPPRFTAQWTKTIGTGTFYSTTPVGPTVKVTSSYQPAKVTATVSTDGTVKWTKVPGRGYVAADGVTTTLPDILVNGSLGILQATGLDASGGLVITELVTPFKQDPTLPPPVVVISPNFREAILTPVLSTAVGGFQSITGFTVTDPGYGYRSAPTFTLTAPSPAITAYGLAQIDQSTGMVVSASLKSDSPVPSYKVGQGPTVTMDGPASGVALMGLPVGTGTTGTSPSPLYFAGVGGGANYGWKGPPDVTYSDGTPKALIVQAATLRAVMGVNQIAQVSIPGNYTSASSLVLEFSGGGIDALLDAGTYHATAAPLLGPNQITVTSGGSFTQTGNLYYTQIYKVTLGTLTYGVAPSFTSRFGVRTVSVGTNSTTNQNFGYTGLPHSASLTGSPTFNTYSPTFNFGMGVSGTSVIGGTQFLQVASSGSFNASCVVTAAFPSPNGATMPGGAGLKNADSSKLSVGIGLKDVQLVSGGTYGAAYLVGLNGLGQPQAVPPSTFISTAAAPAGGVAPVLTWPASGSPDVIVSFGLSEGARWSQTGWSAGTISNGGTITSTSGMQIQPLKMASGASLTNCTVTPIFGLTGPNGPSTQIPVGNVTLPNGSVVAGGSFYSVPTIQFPNQIWGSSHVYSSPAAGALGLALDFLVQSVPTGIPTMTNGVFTVPVTLGGVTQLTAGSITATVTGGTISQVRVVGGGTWDAYPTSIKVGSSTKTYSLGNTTPGTGDFSTALQGANSSDLLIDIFTYSTTTGASANKTIVSNAKALATPKYFMFQKPAFRVLTVTITNPGSGYGSYNGSAGGNVGQFGGMVSGTNTPTFSVNFTLVDVDVLSGNGGSGLCESTNAYAALGTTMLAAGPTGTSPWLGGVSGTPSILPKTYRVAKVFVSPTAPNGVAGRGYSCPGTSVGFQFLNSTQWVAASGQPFFGVSDVRMPAPDRAAYSIQGNGYTAQGALTLNANPSTAVVSAPSVNHHLTINECWVDLTYPNALDSGGVLNTPDVGVALPYTVTTGAVGTQGIGPFTSKALFTISSLQLTRVDMTSNPGIAPAYSNLKVYFPATTATNAVQPQATVTSGINGVSVTNPGRGYLSIPTLKIQGTSTAIPVTDLQVVDVDVLDGGIGYTNRSQASVTVSPNKASGIGSFSNGTGVFQWKSGYGMEIKGVRVTNPGGSYRSVPDAVKWILQGQDVSRASLIKAPSIAIADLQVTGLGLTERGFGYLTAPSEVQFIGGGGSGASAAVSGMKVIDLRLTSSGNGYTSLPKISIDGGGGSGATASVEALKILSMRVTNAGIGYQYPPISIYFTRQGADLPDFTLTRPLGVPVTQSWGVLQSEGYVPPPQGLGVTRVDVKNAGTGYTSVPKVVFDVAPGDPGTGADAEVIGLAVNGIQISADAPGGGYWGMPNLQFTPQGTPLASDPTKMEYAVQTPAVAQMVPIDLQGLATIAIADAGEGVLGTPTILIKGGGGSGAEARITSMVNGKVAGVTITKRGQGYTSNPTVVLDAQLDPAVSTARAPKLDAVVLNAVYTIGSRVGEAGARDGDVDTDKILFSSPRGLAMDSTGSLFICDTGNSVIRKIYAPLASDSSNRRSFKVTTVAGRAGRADFANGVGSAAFFNSPEGIAVAPDGVAGIPSGLLYVADTGNHVIRTVTQAGVVSTIAGVKQLAGQVDTDASSGTVALFRNPKGIDLDRYGNVYVADYSNHAIRKISAFAPYTVSTVAGVMGVAGYVDNAKVSEFSYQWRLDGSPIDGATSPTYEISNVTGKAGNYDVLVTSLANATNQASSSVSQVKNPSLTTVLADLPTQPTVVYQEAGTTLSVSVSAFPTPEYQWYRYQRGAWVKLVDGADWGGTKTDTLQLYAKGAGPGGSSAGAQPGHSGLYKVTIGTTESRPTELIVRHKPILGNVLTQPLALSTRGGHSLAIHRDGSLWTWGVNGSSQLGNMGTDTRSLPLRAGTSSWSRVAAGLSHSVAIDQSGMLYGWGDNTYGQLGTGGAVPVWNTTTRISEENVWLEIAAGKNHTLAIKGDTYYGPKTVSGWGPAQSISRSFQNAALPPDAKVRMGSGAPTDDLGAVGEYYVDRSAGGTLWGWGMNDSSQLGPDPSQVLYRPQQIGTRTNWKSVAAGGDSSAGILLSGDLLTWGNNQYGQLGDGTTFNHAIPTAVAAANPPRGAVEVFVKVAVGDSHMMALISSPGVSQGRLYVWGNAAAGRLGLAGVGSVVSSPTQVTTTAVDGSVSWRWADISAGADHSLAIDENGRLYAWGSNSAGQLGLGAGPRGLAENASGVLLPTRVTPCYPDDGARWVSVVGGDRHTLGVTTDGMVWSWGANNVGEIGNGSRGDGISSIVLTNGGSGYSSQNPPTVSISGGDGTGATAKAWVDDATGKVAWIQVISMGSGYSPNPSTPLTVQIDPPTTGARLPAFAVASLNQLDPCKIGSPGSIFLDAAGTPLTYHTRDKLPPTSLRVWVIENPDNAVSSSYQWKAGNSVRASGDSTDLTRKGYLELPAPIYPGAYTLTVNNDQCNGVPVVSPVVCTVLQVPKDLDNTNLSNGEVPDLVPVKNDPFGVDLKSPKGTDLTLVAPKLVSFGDASAPYNVPTYQWSFFPDIRSDVNRDASSTFPSNVSGVTSGSLAIKNPTLANTGKYKVTITYNFGNAYSDTNPSGLGAPILRSYSASQTVYVLDLPAPSVSPLSLAPSQRSIAQTGDTSLAPIYVENGEVLTLGVAVPTAYPTGVKQILVPAGGTGSFSRVPEVRIEGGGGVAAKAVAILSGSLVTGVNVTSPGSGYTSAPSVRFVANGSVTSGSAYAVLDNGVTQYRWLKGSTETNGVEIPDSNTPQIKLTADSDAVSGIYTVSVRNVAGSADLLSAGSVAAWNIVYQTPVRILQQPQASLQVLRDETFSLSVVATTSTKPAPETYQWYFTNDSKNDPTLDATGKTLPPDAQKVVDDANGGSFGASGATTPTLKISKADPDKHTGHFYVKVTNIVKGTERWVLSSAQVGKVSVLSTKIAPSIPSAIVRGGGRPTQGSKVTLSVSAVGQPLYYAWYRDNLPIPGETASTLVLPSIQLAQSGVYKVVVSNDLGSASASTSVQVVSVGAKAVQARLEVDKSSLAPGSFYVSPSIPSNSLVLSSGSLALGTKMKISGVAPNGQVLRGWTVTNEGKPALQLSGATVQFILGAGTTRVTPRVGRSFAGTYEGLLTTAAPWDRAGGAATPPPDGSTVRGKVKVTVSSTGNTVSGKVTVEGEEVAFASNLALDSTGAAKFSMRIRNSTVQGTLQLDPSDYSADRRQDAGMKVTLGTDTNGVNLRKAPAFSNGSATTVQSVLYSIAVGNSSLALPSNTYTAAICSSQWPRQADWTSLGRGGCLNLTVTGYQISIWGYLGNGVAWTYSGTPGVRYPDDSGESWDNASSGAIATVASDLASAATTELLTRQSGSLGMIIYDKCDSTVIPYAKQLAGGMVFSSRGVIGALGVVDVRYSDGKNPVVVYPKNLLRGFPYATTLNSSNATVCTPFDQNQAPAALYSSVSYPRGDLVSFYGNAIAALQIQIGGALANGSQFTQRTPVNPLLEPVASNINFGTGGAKVTWASQGPSGAPSQSSTPDKGLFAASFSETNQDFQVSAQRLQQTPPVSPVIFSGNSATVQTQVIGVVLQGEDGDFLKPGGYGFLLRGSSVAEKLANVLGAGNVESAVNASDASKVTERTEAIQLVPK